MEAGVVAPPTVGTPHALRLGVPPSDLHERTRLFALAVLRFCRLLPRTAEAQEVAGQLRRAANAVHSNYRAARRGRSYKEFRAKLGTVYEEADECVGHLEYLRDGDIGHNAALLRESQELASIFGASIRTARRNARSASRAPKTRPESPSE